MVLPSVDNKNIKAKPIADRKQNKHRKFWQFYLMESAEKAHAALFVYPLSQPWIFSNSMNKNVENFATKFSFLLWIFKNDKLIINKKSLFFSDLHLLKYVVDSKKILQSCTLSKFRRLLCDVTEKSSVLLRFANWIVVQG